MAISSDQVLLHPLDLDDDQRALYDEITAGPRGGSDAPFALTTPEGALRGPFAAMLLAPAVGHAVQQLGSTLRFGSGLDERSREIAILVVARAMGSVFERDAHEAVAVRCGFTRSELDFLRAGDHSDFSPRERLVADLVTALVEHPATDVTGAGLTLAELYELTTIAGYYRMLATQLRLFDLDEPA